jgi:hypothetical protein
MVAQLNDKDPDQAPKPLRQRLAWLVGIWAASVAALAVVAYLLRLFMAAAGMTG